MGHYMFVLCLLTTACMCQGDSQLICRIERGVFLRLVKVRESYKLQLYNSNLQCRNIAIINCNCMCQRYHSQEQDTTDHHRRKRHSRDKCESIHTLLTDFCARDTSNHLDYCPISNSTSPQQETKTTGLTTTPNLSAVNKEQLEESCIRSVTTSNCTLLTALGVLVGLLMALLIIVTIGWIWTCGILWRRGGQKDHNHSKESESGRNNKAEGQCCTNPTYGETSQSQSTTLITGTAAYEALDLSSQQSVATRNGQTYNILNRGQVKDSGATQDTGNMHDDANYSHLDKNHTLDKAEEGRGGEKHVYHIHGEGDNQDTEQDITDGTEDYLVPVSSKDVFNCNNLPMN